MITLKNKFALLFLFFLAINVCEAGDTLYYAVGNVSTLWNSTKEQTENSSEDIDIERNDEENGSTKTTDAYLIPVILNEIKAKTKFTYCLKKEKSKVKQGYHLTISLNKFVDLIEYQFKLSEIKRKDSVIAQTAFFINPKNPDYINVIQTEIGKLFPAELNNNKPPIARIRLNNKLIGLNDTNIYYRTTTDTIFLDGTSSEDDNTPKKHFEYSWSVSKSGQPNAFIPGFNSELSTQKLTILDTGIYTFFLAVSDGIVKSEHINTKVVIKVIPQQKIESFKNSAIYVQNSLTKHLTKLKLRKNVDSIPYFVENFKAGTKFKMSYLNSYDKNEKYFINGSLNLPSKTLEFNFKPNLSGTLNQIDYSGLSIDTNSITHPIGTIKYSINEDIKPGIHTYALSTEFNGVKSNTDTLQITYREKSTISFTLGIVSYDVFEDDVLRGDNFSNRVNINAAKFGFRGYISDRIFADLEVLFPNYASSDAFEDSTFSIHSFLAKVNYDLFPLSSSYQRSNKPFAYLTAFASFHQMIIAHDNASSGYLFAGFGVKPRFQLFKKHPQIGILSLEGEIGYQFEVGGNPNKFQSYTFGVGLVYGFVNY